MNVAKRIIIALLAGALAGALVGGIGGRIAMRIVVLATDHFPLITLGGTLLILILGIMFGMVGGLLFMATRRLIPGPPRLKGIAMGVALFGAVGAPSLLSPESELGIGPPLLGLLLAATLFILYGFCVQEFVQRLETLWLRIR